MQLSIFFDKNIHDATVRGNGLETEVTSFNFISDIGYLSLRLRDGGRAEFHHVTGVIAVEPKAESEHWANRFGSPVRA